MAADSPDPQPEAGGAPPQQSVAVRVLTSESFVEKLLLLILTVLISGAVIPIAIKQLDTARESREALKRSQTKLFEDFSETVLTYETLILDVTWYGTAGARNPAMQEAAFKRYSERSVDLVSRWRVEASRAQTLASPAVAKKMHDFMARFFIEQDTPMNVEWNKCGTSCKDWEVLHVKNEDMLGDADSVIEALAVEMKLSNPQASSSAASAGSR